MKKLLALTSLIAVLVSCQSIDDEPYQKFSDADFEFIPENYEESGTVLRFRNQENEEVQIEPTFFTLSKEYQNGLSFSQPNSDSYYYDNVWITLELLNVDIQNDGDDYCNQISIRIYKVGDGRLSTEIGIPSYDEPFCYGNGFNGFSPYENLMEMEVNDITYTNVKVIVPNEYFTLYNDSQIDKVYYDFDKGLIGFDDSQNNKEYRLVTE